MAAVQVAVAWLREEDWPRWKRIDPELPPYARWLEKISAAIADAERRGAKPVKVPVDPDAFAEWCATSGKPVNRDTRASYAAQALVARSHGH